MSNIEMPFNPNHIIKIKEEKKEKEEKNCKKESLFNSDHIKKTEKKEKNCNSICYRKSSFDFYDFLELSAKILVLSPIIMLAREIYNYIFG